MCLSSLKALLQKAFNIKRGQFLTPFLRFEGHFPRFSSYFDFALGKSPVLTQEFINSML